MSYATVADMVARFGEDTMIQLTDQQRTGEVNHDAAQLALEDATAEINGYLGRYPLPFAEIPPILTRLCCDIARYRLCSTSTVLMNEDILNKYRVDALGMLKSIANGLVTLGVKTDGAQVDTGDVVEFAPGGGRVFGRR
jgi:phage gp36-like protein